MAPIGIAIIGGGIFIKDHHLPAVFKCDNLSVKVIYSRSLKTAQETSKLVTGDAPDLYAGDAGSGRTYHDLLLREDVQAVIIALPIPSQPEYIEAALAAGKHVLAEKPIAGDVAAARKILDYYRNVSPKNKVTLAIAENHRFFPSFVYAAEQAAGLGKLQHFSVKCFSLMGQDNKYYNTPWRTKPQYQGGFLLDGGVHHAAATRLFLNGDTNGPHTVQAFTQQAQDHLPPIDTVSAIIKTRSGATGTYQHSAGSNVRAFEWDLGYEKGSVNANEETVTVTPVGGEKTVKQFERTSGVDEEVAAWAQSLADGKPNPRQSPEEALADLEFLEKMFKSGDENGTRQTYEFQL